MAESDVTIEGLIKKDADNQQDSIGSLIKGEFRAARTILGRIENALTGSAKILKKVQKEGKKPQSASKSVILKTDKVTIGGPTDKVTRKTAGIHYFSEIFNYSCRQAVFGDGDEIFHGSPWLFFS